MKKAFLLLLSLASLEAKEFFKPENISEYLTESNPFVSTIVNREHIAKEKIGYYKGAFDTRISTKYDNKEYPATTGEYSELFAKKRIENGLELYAGYRKSEGTQEYNNIKTGKKGEMQLALKMPVIELFKGINSHKAKLDIAILDSDKFKLNSKNGLRLLHFEVLKAYYLLLYSASVLEFEQQLLNKAEKRRGFIERRVKAGSLPEISLLEAEQQIVNREQRLFVAQTDYENSFTDFVKYLNISKNDFSRKYKLNSDLKISIERFSFDEAFETAKENRPDLKMLDFDKKRLQVERSSAELLKYPKVNLTLYGVHDIKYGNGFKVSIGMDFPIERSKYHSKIGEYTKSIENVQQSEEKRVIEIKTAIQNIISSLDILESNIRNAGREIELVKRLEEAESKKYKVGSSSLFLLNQREIYTLETEKKNLKYKLNYTLLKEQLYIQMGNSSI
jgi:outer membrane protein TolC